MLIGRVNRAPNVLGDSSARLYLDYVRHRTRRGKTTIMLISNPSTHDDVAKVYLLVET